MGKCEMFRKKPKESSNTLAEQNYVPPRLVLAQETHDSIDQFNHDLRALKVASDGGDVRATMAAVNTFLHACSHLTIEAVSIMGLMPELYEAAADLDWQVFGDNQQEKWLGGNLEWIEVGKHHVNQTAYWSPVNVGVDVGPLARLRKALHPGWKAKGEVQ